VESPEGVGSSPTADNVGRSLVNETDALDRASYDAVAGTPTPTLDVLMSWISNAASYSRLWVVIATALTAVGGDRGRRAASRGLIAVGATAITTNLVAKHIFPRGRPKRLVVTAGRHARMPMSSSFPSGHAASAFAFATAVTADLPLLSLPIYGLATAVSYSRVHTGVHYPSDVMGGGILGAAVGTAVREATLRLAPLPHRLGTL
jgi:undecaprenyl-diphosphatase